MFLRFIPGIAYEFHSCLRLIFYHKDIAHCADLFICWWTLELFLYSNIHCFFLKIVIYFFNSCIGSLLVRAGFSLVAVSRHSSSWQCAGFSLRRLLLLRSTGSRACGLQQMWCTGLVSPSHVESSWIRVGTHVPCIGRQVLNHWTTMKFWVLP